MEEIFKHFLRIEAGKWTCVMGGEFQSPNGRIQVAIGSTFTRGTIFMGFDLAKALDEHYERSRLYQRPPSRSQTDGTRR